MTIVEVIVVLVTVGVFVIVSVAKFVILGVVAQEELIVPVELMVVLLMPVVVMVAGIAMERLQCGSVFGVDGRRLVMVLVEYLLSQW